ncbi:AEC family transporter [Haloparvum alkalitolerans]|uniref:AEC family transporter n=1 Tax=Haloparvum alkalitolerans TaxID=1042953 RepID=UPI003CF3E9CB
MNALLGVFASAVLPVVAIAAAGFLLGRVRDVEPGPLNTVTVYVLAPALVFHSLATSTLAAGTLARVAVGVVAFTLAMAAVAEGVGRIRGTEEPLLSALLLVAVFSNSGNLGIPVSDFAFGETGRSTAVLFLSVQAVLMYTVGVYVASRSGGASGLDGLKRVVRLPLVYAVAGALLARGAGVVPPAEAASMEAVGLVGDSAIPVMLIVLGLQLARTDYAAAVSKAGVGSALKLLVAPAVGLAVAHLVGFSDPTVARVFVLETAMPAAITPVILVAEFAGNRDLGGISVPEYVSTVVLVTTLLSIPLLTVLIVALQSGVLI